MCDIRVQDGNVKMSKLVLYGLFGVIISVISLVGFVFISSTPALQFRYAFVLAYIAVTLCLFVFAARSLSAYSVVCLGFVVAIASVSVEQFLAFWRFPGLVKDLTMFGLEHLQKTAVILGGAICWYLFVAFVAIAIELKMRGSH
jgi:hypothetical protein